MKKAFLAFLALLHLGLAALFVSDESSGNDAAYREFPLDDAWILMVYARSVAEHGGPYYNDGQLETGFTSPLWMLLGAGVHLIHKVLPSLDLVLLLKALGVLIAFLGSCAVLELAQRLGAGIWGAGLAAALHALSPHLAFAQVSGMEVSLAGGLAVWALVALFDRSYTWAGWALAAAYWSRPEMGLLLVLALAAAVFEWKRSAFTQKRRDLFRIAGPFFLLAGIWAAYCYAVSGGFVPTTATTKLQFQEASRWGNFFLEVIWPSPSNFLLSGAVLLFAGYAAWIRRPNTAAIVTLLFPWLFFLAIGITRSQPIGTAQSLGTDSCFYFTRYGLPAIPLLFVGMGAGFGFLWNEIQETGKRRMAFRLLACLLGVLALVRHPESLRERAAIYSRNCKNIEELQVRIGHWIAQNTLQDAAIASHDAGAIRYFGNRPVIDYLGLNDHRIARDREKRSKLLASPQFLAEFMKERGAQYLLMVPTFFPVRLRPEDPLTLFVRHPDFLELFETAFEAESYPYTLGGSIRHSKMGVWKRR